MTKLRGALIGLGFIGSKGHLPAYQVRDDVEIVAVCDICDELKEQYKDVTFYTDYRELLKNEKLDFVDIATHAASHAQIVHDALDSGVHVLCEKPLTTSLADAKEIIEHAVKAKRVLFPCHNYKHAPVVKAIREVIESGKIGKVRSITLNTFRNTHAKGLPHWKTDWRRYNEFSGGGIAMDHGSHSLYLTYEWLGGHPKSVTASMYNLSAGKYDTEDNFNATYEFENGIATLHLTWTAGVRKVIYTIQGSDGAITVDDDAMQVAKIKVIEGEGSHHASWEVERFDIKSDWMDSSHVSWFNSMFDLFKTAIEKGDTLNHEIKDAYFCIQSIMKAYESARNNSIKIEMNNKFDLN